MPNDQREFWRLRVYLNRLFEALGISG